VHPREVVARVPEPLVVGDLVVGRAVRHRVAVAVGVVVAVPRVLSVGPVARPDVAASRRSSGVKSSTRWRRPRLVAYASSKATARRSGLPEAHR
jgi:hypothetical protein